MTIKNNKGFTLIELMVAGAISLIVLGTLVATFKSQQRTYTYQQQVTDINQSVRVTVKLIKKAIQNAGADPSDTLREDLGSKLGFVQATSVSINLLSDFGSYTDLNNDGDVADPNEKPDGQTNNTDATYEDITFAFDSINSQITMDINDGQGAQVLADRINSLLFTYYILADNNGMDNNIDDDGDGTIDNPGELFITNAPTASMLPFIRLVKLSITSVSSTEDPNYTSSNGIDLDSSSPGLARTRSITTFIRPRNLI